MFPLKPKMLITKIIRKWERCKIVRRETANASEMFQAFLICPAINHVSKKEINTRPNNVVINCQANGKRYDCHLWWIGSSAVINKNNPWSTIQICANIFMADSIWCVWGFFFCYPIMNIPLCQPLPPPPTNKLWGIRRYDCWFSLELINELSRFICSHVPTESPNSIQVISLGRSQNTPYAPTDAKM